jgi:diguanylate cyclase (GGDEF)-like protein
LDSLSPVSLRLLLLEDELPYAELTKEMLQGRGSMQLTVDHSTSVRRAIDALGLETYDIALVDLGLPDAQDLEALDAVAAAAPDLPVIILSSTESEALALRAVQGGAQDYLIKGQATPELLLRAIRYAIERKQSERRIRHLAYYDSLTLLPNRRLLIEHLGLALRRASRAGTAVGVFFIDVDRFKQINDAFGHAAGDRVLTELAERLSQSLRKTDTLARLSGDEFVAVVEVNHVRALTLVAESLQHCLTTPFTAAGDELFATVSIGVCSFPNDGSDVNELIRNADQAMYRAKSLGRDTVCFYSAARMARPDQLSFATALRRAAERRQLMLYFQPLINLKTRKVDGLEALLRWRHPSHGIMPPGEFIHLAEESDLILLIERWALHEAMSEAVKLSKTKSLKLAVNVSRRHFEHPSLVTGLRAIGREVGYDLRHLELELTESGLMHHPKRVAHHLKACRDLGITVTVDDFGTGYSCLDLMKNFPLGSLKIDRTFVRNCGTDPTNRALVAAIISMGHALGLQVTAEGVQTRSELNYLRKQQCDRAQGWYFGRPVPGPKLPALLGSTGGRTR